MHFTATNIITIVAVIGLLITAATVVGGSFRVSRNTATVTRYKEAADSWQAKAVAQDEKIEAQEERITVLQHEIAAKDAAFTAEMSAKDTLISQLQGRLSVLQEVVTGKAVLDEISQRQVEFLNSWDNRTGEILNQVAATRGENRAIHERLDVISAQLEDVGRGRTSRNRGPGPAA